MKFTLIHHLTLAVALLLTATPGLAQGGTTDRPAPIRTVDSLLAAYPSAAKATQLAIARQLLDISTAVDKLLDIGKPLTAKTPADTLDFYVWLAAERYYFTKSYFKESLECIDKALALSKGNAPLYHATLLCDKGYCLYKTEVINESGKVEREAERYSKEHGLLMPLARAYNYMAIVNLALGTYDDAKNYVRKAIDTDRLTGSDANTHNYLGIACEIFTATNEPATAIKYGEQAVEAARKIGYQDGVINHLSQLSLAYNRNGEFEKALKISQDVVRMVEQMPVVDRNLLSISLEYVTFNLLDLQRFDEAVPVIRRAIALDIETGNKLSECYEYQLLAKAYERDHPREALRALGRYAMMMDSLHNVELHEAVSQANAALHNDELQEAAAQVRARARFITIGSVVGFLLLLAIIGVLVYVNRLRLRTQRATQELQASREAFFTNVTHEFRTPLTVVLGLTRQLKTDDSLRAAEGELEAIERNGEQLLTLVNQLLDISKVTTATGRQEWQEGDLATFLRMTVERYRPLADNGDVDLSFDGPEGGLHTFFVADYMQKIVGNLVSNALKFTPQGGKVDVGMQTSGGHLVLSVSDTGRGIRAEDVSHVFEPFFQGSDNTHTGTGVGLALVAQLAKALGGKVSVESDPGVRTTFTVSLPMKERLEKTDRRAESTALTAAGPVVTPTRQAAPAAADKPADDTLTRILVVEDNADVAAYIGSVLGTDYAVAYAADGAEGERKAQEWMPDLVITDVMMPEVDGLELCRRLRASEHTNHIPIVIITARATDADRIDGLQVGADAYLSKPFLAEELLLRVTRLLEMREVLQRRFRASMFEPTATGSATVAEASEPAASSAGVVSSSAEAVSSSAGVVPSASERVSSANEAFLLHLNDTIMRLMAESKFDVAMVDEALCMSRGQLSRKLKAVIDMSPLEYILDVRMREVKRLLLQQPPLSYLDIALRCGFADNAHLTHAFRRKFGIPPSQFVKEAGKS